MHFNEGQSTARKDVSEISPATPMGDALPRRFADFDTLGEALDYAAKGVRGLNFHDARGALARPYPYSELREDALAIAYRLIAHGVVPGDRIALVAETGAEFAALFFGAIYAGAWPVPLPLPTSFGGRDSYIDQLTRPARKLRPEPVPLPARADRHGRRGRRSGRRRGHRLGRASPREPAAAVDLPKADPDDIAYLQYSSGSTRFPHGVAVTHRALLNNLAAHSHGMEVRDTDRCISWLPWYHDMGLVGCLLSPVANQVSTDYLKTEDFARRPLAWLDLISRNEGTTLSYSPTFGYDICARRIGSQSKVVGAVRPVALAGRRQRRRHDPPRRDAVVRRRLRRRRLQGVELPAELRPRRSDARGLDHAAGRRHRRRAGRGDPARRRRRGRPQPAAALPRDRQLRQAGQATWTSRSATKTAARCPTARSARSGARGPSIMARLFPRRAGDRSPASTPTGWLDTGDMGYHVRRLSLHRRPRQGHDHHQRQEPLAAGHRMGGRAACRASRPATSPRSRSPRPAARKRRRCWSSAAPRTSSERSRLRDEIRDRVRAITGMNCVIELVPPRTLPRTSSGKLSRAKARNLYLSGEIQPYDIAA